MIIYKITNLINQKIYIGQTVQPMKYRWKAHCSKHNGCLHLAGAIKKYGKESFSIEQIDSAEDLNSLNDKEAFWITYFNSMNPNVGYNLMSGGNNKRHSESSIQKIRDAKKLTSKKGKDHHLYGTTWGAEAKLKAHNTRQLVGYSRSGVKLSEETKEKMRIAAKKPSSVVYERGRQARQYIKNRGWICNLKEAKRRLIEEVITLLKTTQGNNNE